MGVWEPGLKTSGMLCHPRAVSLYRFGKGIIPCPAVDVCLLLELNTSNPECFVNHDVCWNHRWGSEKNFYSHCLYDVNDSLDKNTSFYAKLKILNLWNSWRLYTSKSLMIIQVLSILFILLQTGEEKKSSWKILWPCFLLSEWSWLSGKSMKCFENSTLVLPTSHTKIQLFTWDEDCLCFIYSLKTH